MQEHAKRIKRIQLLCAELDDAIRASKDLLETAAAIEAEVLALRRELRSPDDTASPRLVRGRKAR